MAKIKRLITVFLILVSVVLLTAYWINQHNILSGEYDKLTISGMEGTTIQVISDPGEMPKSSQPLMKAQELLSMIMDLHMITYRTES